MKVEKNDGGSCLPALSDDVRQWNRYCEYCIGSIEYNSGLETIVNKCCCDATIGYVFVSKWLSDLYFERSIHS